MCKAAPPPGTAAPARLHLATRTEDVTSPEDYLIYKMLEVEYLVEFSRNCMPFQEPVSLPFSGIGNNSVAKRDLLSGDHDMRGWKRISIGNLKKGAKKLGGAVSDEGKESIAKGKGVVDKIIEGLPPIGKLSVNENLI
jgi:hypothetical protein